MFWNISEGIKDICRDIKYNSKNWEADEYRFYNKEKGIYIWIANALYGMDISGIPKLTWFERICILRAIKDGFGNKLNEIEF
jgi:hypothetical protein